MEKRRLFKNRQWKKKSQPDRLKESFNHNPSHPVLLSHFLSATRLIVLAIGRTRLVGMHKTNQKPGGPRSRPADTSGRGSGQILMDRLNGHKANKQARGRSRRRRRWKGSTDTDLDKNECECAGEYVNVSVWVCEYRCEFGLPGAPGPAFIERSAKTNKQTGANRVVACVACAVARMRVARTHTHRMSERGWAQTAKTAGLSDSWPA